MIGSDRLLSWLAAGALAGCAVSGCAGASTGAAPDAARPGGADVTGERTPGDARGPRILAAPRPGEAEGPSPKLPSPATVERRLGSWRPLGVRWTPASPLEGTAVGVHLYQPRSGRAAVAVDGEVYGRPVRFARVGDVWFGLAPVPIGVRGTLPLRLRIAVEGDSVVEQAATLEVRGREFPATTLRVDPRFSSPPPDALARIERERQRVREVLATVTPDWLPDGPFRAPRPGGVTSPFGQRRVFNGELRSRHLGVDLPGGTGDPVRAAARGRVALADELYFAGRAVYLDHGLGVYTAYFHLSRIRVTEGEVVEAGRAIGDVGATGRVTGAHLHWSLYVGGESLDAAELAALEMPAPRRGAGG